MIGVGLGIPWRRGASGGGGVVLPTPTAVTFNSADPDYLMRTSLLDNATGATQAMSIYLKFSQNTFNDVILHGENVGLSSVLLIDIGGNTQLRFFLRNTGATVILDARATITTNTTYAAFFSWDGVSGTPLLYVGSDAASAVSNLTDNTSTAAATTTSAITKLALGINRDATSSTAYSGTMTRVCVWDNVTLDVTSQAVREAMEDHTQAASLGNNLIDVYGEASVWNAGTNTGTGGDFDTVVGSVT